MGPDTELRRIARSFGADYFGFADLSSAGDFIRALGGPASMVSAGQL